MPRSARLGCAVCGLTVKQHAESSKRHAYVPKERVLSGEHRTPRLDLKVPDPDGHAARWRAAAYREGVSLGTLIGRLLDDFLRRAT